ncbi:titin [Trichonephila clavata]|uniref:Titin n=1 Tax=Trichonephila clavata TaxID=2740835 RepID=A0A8X6HQV3_TRICU|nr:titin [Trichonephila clavata]
MLVLVFICVATIVLSQPLLLAGSRPPRIKPFNFSGDLSEGLRIMVMCGIMDGDGPFDFRWLKDGEPLLSQKGHFSIESFNDFTSILTIEHLNALSNGNYTCRVTNLAGSDEKSDVLTMKGETVFPMKPKHSNRSLLGNMVA